MPEIKLNKRKTIYKLLLYFKPEFKVVLILLFIVLISVVASLIAPMVQGKAIDIIVDRKFDKLSNLLFLLLLVYGFYSLTALFQSILSAKLSQKIIFKLRNALFNKIINLPVSYIDNHPHGDIMSRMTNDAENIATVISTSLSSMFSGILTLIGTIIIMMYYNVKLTLLCCSTLLITILFINIFSRFINKYFVKKQEILGKLNSKIKESIKNYKTISAYNIQDSVSDDFNTTADELTRTGIIAEISAAVVVPVVNMLGNASFVIVAVFGGYFVLKGYITIGVISAFILYAKNFSFPISQLSLLYAQIASALAGAERIFEVLEYDSEDKSGDILQKPVKGVIEFKNVNFSYVKEKQVIKDFNLTVNPGEKIAIVGSTGSGKTTILNLLMRFYNINSGEILFDGKNIKDISTNELRGAIGIVLQDTILFSDTIKNNLTYAKENATEQEIERIVKYSDCDIVIKNLPNGLDTFLSNSASGISQGEKQLIAIARAFLAKPCVLIFDEATSNVDTRTEKNIQTAMVKLMEGKTSIIIAHRLSTIKNVDKILVMDNGQIVETGTHKELLALKGKYYELYMTQFAGKAI